MADDSDQSYQDNAHIGDWHRRSMHDSGLNTPQSISRCSIDDSEHNGDKGMFSRPISPRSHGSQHGQSDNRPSLPPLRPFLGELAFSPPQSPPPADANAQVDPRIHSINLPRHKALAFYPSNVGRLDRPDDSHAISPPQSPTSTQQSIMPGPSRSISSTQAAPVDYSSVAPAPPPSSTLGPFASNASHAPSMQTFGVGAPIERRASTRARFHDPRYTPYKRTELVHPRPRGLSHPVLAHAGSDFGPQPYPHQQPCGPVYPPVHQQMRPNMAHFGGYNDRYQPAQAFYDGPAVHYGGAMPYDYTFTRARKRSNLPKHSTEIMKKWFDENIDSPYPSEELKRQFAAAANINLTQVSNWFINHRRRCPELRDRRDKNTSVPSYDRLD